jgi:hypothetical protein
LSEKNWNAMEFKPVRLAFPDGNPAWTDVFFDPVEARANLIENGGDNRFPRKVETFCKSYG